MNIKKYSTLLALGAVALVVPAAHADTVSFTATIPSTSTDFSGNAILGKFNTNLGTLLAVQFSLSGNTSVNYSLQNTSGQTHSYTVQGQATMDFTVPSSTVIEIVPASSKTESGVGAGTTRTGSFTGSDSTTFNETAGNFFLYEQSGGGSFNNGYTVSGISGVLGPTPFNFNASQVGDASFTVTYTYLANNTSAPEPGSLALIAVSGLGMVGGIIRRRKA